MPVTVNEINTYDAIREIRTAWLELRQAAGSSSVCSHPDWVHATRFMPSTGTPILLTAHEGERLIGLAPMRIRPYRYRGIPLRKIEFVGHTPQNDFLVRERRDEVVRAFLHRLCGPGRERPWDLFEWNRIGWEAASLGPMMEAMRELGLRPYEMEDHPNGICAVDDWDAYLARRSKSFGKDIRGRENRLTRLGNVSLMRYSGFEDRFGEPGSLRKLEKMFQAAIECARNSWQGHATEGTALSDADAYTFFKEAIHSFASMNQLLFHVLWSGEVPIAFDLSFVDGSLLTDYKAGYRQEFRYYAPGAHLLKTLLEYSSVRGIPRVDLMSIEPGQEYKYRFVDEIHRTRRITVFNRTVNGTLARLLMKEVLPRVKRLLPRKQVLAGMAAI
jgi:CelD/BcsL family acetyltransferase involved in cellulose biosynthesis